MDNDGLNSGLCIKKLTTRHSWVAVAHLHLTPPCQISGSFLMSSCSFSSLVMCKTLRELTWRNNRRLVNQEFAPRKTAKRKEEEEIFMCTLPLVVESRGWTTWPPRVWRARQEPDRWKSEVPSVQRHQRPMVPSGMQIAGSFRPENECNDHLIYYSSTRKFFQETIECPTAKMGICGCSSLIKWMWLRTSVT